MNILQTNILKDCSNVEHSFGTRQGGVSEGKFESFNCSLTQGDSQEAVTENRKRLADFYGVSPEDLIFPSQTHTANIGIVDEKTRSFEETDALITNKKNKVLCVQTADCVPIFLYDPTNEVVAAIHSGWRGTLQGIAPKTLKMMEEKFGTKKKEVIAAIGPCISPEQYEVGQEVFLAFVNKNRNYQYFFSALYGDMKRKLDLWEFNHYLLTNAGIFRKNIEVLKDCTFSNPEMFYSARRDGIKSGRLVNAIMLK